MAQTIDAPITYEGLAPDDWLEVSDGLQIVYFQSTTSIRSVVDDATAQEAFAAVASRIAPQSIEHVQHGADYYEDMGVRVSTGVIVGFPSNHQRNAGVIATKPEKADTTPTPPSILFMEPGSPTPEAIVADHIHEELRIEETRPLAVAFDITEGIRHLILLYATTLSATNAVNNAILEQRKNTLQCCNLEKASSLVCLHPSPVQAWCIPPMAYLINELQEVVDDEEDVARLDTYEIGFSSEVLTEAAEMHSAIRAARDAIRDESASEALHTVKLLALLFLVEARYEGRTLQLSEVLERLEEQVTFKAAIPKDSTLKTAIGQLKNHWFHCKGVDVCGYSVKGSPDSGWNLFHTDQTQ